MKREEQLALKKAEYEGSVFKTNNYGDVEVTEYIDSYNITVKFLNTGNVRKTGTSELKKGEIRDNEAFPVYIVGVMDVPNEARRNVPIPKEYSIWNGVRQRCYNENIRHLTSSYQEAEMSENFKRYSYFKEWCHNQIGFNVLDDKGKTFALDKDILVKGNKVYSEETCAFVPNEINCLIHTGKSYRGLLPQGVVLSSNKKRYRARVSMGGKYYDQGTFDTPEEAFMKYKEVKESHIKEVADKYKDVIDPRVYDALYAWTINIDD